MSKILKILGRTLGIAIEWLIVLVLFLAFAIRTSPVQTYFASLVTSYLSKELHVEVKIDKVDIVLLDNVEINGILLRDESGDTLFSANKVWATIADYNLRKRIFHLGDVEIDKLRLGIERDTAGVFNYQFIRDRFEPKKKKPFTLIADSVIVKNSRFSYDDNRKERQTYGVDYFHILAGDINTIVKDFKIENQEYTATIQSVSCKEKSGFNLKDLYTEAIINSSGVYLSNVDIKSPGSHVEAKKFDMLSTGFIDFKYFVDSVRFDGTIDRSTIDLQEGALFAPILKGMTDTIQLSGALYRETKNLKVSNLKVRLKEKTSIHGTFYIPDFRKFEQGFLQEKIFYAYIDAKELSQIKMPESTGVDFIELNPRIERLGHFEIDNARLDGFISQFVVAAENIKTSLGKVRVDNGIMFTKQHDKGYYTFEKSGAGDYDVKIEQLHLGRLTGDPKIGVIDGIFSLSGEARSITDIAFTSIEGDIHRLDYLDYPYEKITILEGSLDNQVFDGKIEVADDNLNMKYDGSIDFKGTPHLKFTIEVENAVLDKLHLSNTSSELSSIFKVDLHGQNPNNFRGTVHMNSFHLRENGKSFKIPSLDLTITRSVEADRFDVASGIINGYIEGKLNFDFVLRDLSAQLGHVMPNLFETPPTKYEGGNKDHFTFDFTVQDANDFLAIFVPDLKIASGTKINGHYFANTEDLKVDFNCSNLMYTDMSFKDVELKNNMTNSSLLMDVHLGSFVYNDSISFNDVYFKSLGGNNKMDTRLSWEENTKFPSFITWDTEIHSAEKVSFDLSPSYFYVQKHKWEIVHSSKVTLENEIAHVTNFELQRNDQHVLLDGQISQNDDDHLNFIIKSFELEEISNFISDIPIEGQLHGGGYISNPFHNFQYVGNANIYQLKTKNRLVGDISVESKWNGLHKSVELDGNLIYKGAQTFDFIGSYFPNREKEKLDFNLDFDYTDIQFSNAFLDPEVMSEIKGLINGTLKVTGSPDQPILNGSINLVAGSAMVDLLGTHFGVDGPIEVDEYGFYMNGIPVFDEEGNAGMLIGSIFHDNFHDFNFDLLFNLEDDAINKDPLKPWLVKPLDKFLVLNSQYEAGDVYYGKGYARGIVDVFGYTDNLEVTVDLETRKGTKINIPMYGIGEIENESFIVYVNKDTLVEIEEPKIDFTGVDMDLKFKVTKDAEVKIIFNEEINDEITARGHGDINIGLNNLGDVTMNGTYIVDNGIYNFAMGPIIEKFYIAEGGSISWTGDPYEAFLNLRTYYEVRANIATATNSQFGSTSGAHQKILCYLDLTESIYKPKIQFDLEAPNADEFGKSVITRIKSDPDELNRQFFSLVLWKSFQPLAGTSTANANAALDLVENQINAILSSISDDYKMNVNLNSDQRTGDNTYEFGVSKGFLDDRLILSGSFGVENRQVSQSEKQSNVIGDVKLEYLLNQDGSIRVNIFNESNDKTIIQNADQGNFTQGAGLTYKEDFRTVKDFKLIQYFLDFFRKKENKRYPDKRKRKQVKVPEM